MTEQARVIEINGSQALLGSIKAICGTCQIRSRCGISEHTYTARNDEGLELHPGDIVEVFLPPGKTIIAAFNIMILPLLLFLAFFLFASRVLGISSEGVNVLIGLLGLGLGLGGNLIYGKLRSEKSLPQITAKR